MKTMALRGPWMYRALLAAVVTLLLISFAVYSQQASAGMAQTTSVALAVPAQAKTGALIKVELVANNAQNLAGYQATVRYDAASIRLSGAQIAEGLKASGRDVVPLGPVLRDGSAVLGAATCPVAACNDAVPSRAQRITKGTNGRVVLGVLEFYTETAGRHAVTLEGVQLVDPQGNLLSASVANATLEVAAK